MNQSELLRLRTAELDALRRSPLARAYVCDDSLPILYFGSLCTATTLTIGVNPSMREYLASDDTRIPSGDRRFLHKSDLTGSREQDISAALARMKTYFSRDPDVAYWDWFVGLECFLLALGVSFSDGSAAHTDALSCFATDRRWRDVPARAKREFSASAAGTLEAVVRSANLLRDVVVIGPTARKALGSAFDLTYQIQTTEFDDLPKVRVFVPVLQTAIWRLNSRVLRVVGVGPNWDKPLRPLNYEEMFRLGERTRSVLRDMERET